MGVKDALEFEFRTSDLGIPHPLLSIQFDYHDDPSVSLHQREYVQKIVSDFCMKERQTVITPMSPKVSLNPSTDRKGLDDDARARYGLAIGALVYLMTGTRLDIALAPELSSARAVIARILGLIELGSDKRQGYIFLHYVLARERP